MDRGEDERLLMKLEAVSVSGCYQQDVWKGYREGIEFITSTLFFTVLLIG